jgi:plasmid maintenance system antidote protein VapI
MKNPFARVQAQFRLSHTDMAAGLGVPYSTWNNVIAGNVRPPASVLDALEALGLDPAALREEYEVWRSWKRQQAQVAIREAVCA